MAGSNFSNKNIILAVTGSIAAYKACSICSSLVKRKANVFPVMTPNATNFINPLSLSTISGNKTIIESFKNKGKAYHISLAHSADVILIAPATANTIAKIAHGIADNFLSTTVLSANCPTVIAPAMNESMYLNSFTRENIQKLADSGRFYIMGTKEGRLACGEEGRGNLEAEEKIIEKCLEVLKLNESLRGKKILVSAGGTREYIDKVRFISNASSGKMGYALAEEAVFRGGEVVLVTTKKGMVPCGVKPVYVESSQEMKEGLLSHYSSSDIIIMSAAVSDIVPVSRYNYKLKKKNDILSKLRFKINENILEILQARKEESQILVGFAAETGEEISNAHEKIKEKNIDLLVANNISREDIGLDSDFNEVVLINQKMKQKKIGKAKKRIIAREIFNEIINNLMD
ncbi:MAG: bifunctional phosphopantothenoylcysteine decarboxylase/phosphopantothenate--cysteine ligase CoaBC [Actinomycetota bacterium]